jgi:hypothetical protein
MTILKGARATVSILFFQSFSLTLMRYRVKNVAAGCSKMPRCKAPEILKSEAYLNVRRNDEG